MSKRPSSRPKKCASKSTPRAGRARATSSRALRARASGASARPAAACALNLPAECTLADATSLKVRLTALLMTQTAIAIDVSGVRRIDTASLQLLAAFARDRRASRLAVELRGESAAFQEALRLTGLTRLFDLPPGTRPA